MFGQALSMVLAGTGVCSAILSDSCFKSPTFQNLGNYVTLACIFLPLTYYRSTAVAETTRRRSDDLKRRCGDYEGSQVDEAGSADGNLLHKSTVGGDRQVEIEEEPAPTIFLENTRSFATRSGGGPWWPFAILALIDIEANYLVVLAFEYTSVTSVMLLDCFTIPCVIVLSYFFLKYTYTRNHVIGAIVCGVGMALIILSDVLKTSDDDGNSANSCDDDDGDGKDLSVLGDIIALSGAVLYAVSNVVQESLIKSRGPCEYLGRLGLFGTLFGVIQVVAIERNSVAGIEWGRGVDVVLPFLGYVTLLVVAYVATSFFLRDSDAALFNLSLLTSDVYAMLFAYLSGRQSVQWLYFVAFATTSVGLFVYHFMGGPVGRDPRSGTGPGGAISALFSPYTRLLSSSSPPRVAV
eukprot:g212.t1